MLLAYWEQFEYLKAAMSFRKVAEGEYRIIIMRTIEQFQKVLGPLTRHEFLEPIPWL